ncbi:hypothetical protein [Hyalangium sp.]|uniref:hypothetical protein n=1 Tax=Hyalangium sp. TaxID=2028555 RepID=UPI002D49D2A5|nr:hypothetical protein [Hyalangium sp.]HYH95575.1 hypothetical protein [Hyalangium sp.]
MSQVNLENRVIENERLELHPGVVYFLGPDLTLKDCTLILRVSGRNLVIPQAHFINCTFNVKKELKNFRWEHARLEGCRFTGRLGGNDFGLWPDSLPPGHIQDCDFTAAQLDGCRFLECDVRTLRFPPWPCFTVLEPKQRYHELRTVQWPGDIGRIEVEGFAEDPPSTVAVTFAAPALAKRSGTTPEAIKATLEKLDGVQY